jgi:hypothetical protein
MAVASTLDRNSVSTTAARLLESRILIISERCGTEADTARNYTGRGWRGMDGAPRVSPRT